jgi:hypothetical protein
MQMLQAGPLLERSGLQSYAPLQVLAAPLNYPQGLAPLAISLASRSRQSDSQLGVGEHKK